MSEFWWKVLVISFDADVRSFVGYTCVVHDHMRVVDRNAHPPQRFTSFNNKPVKVQILKINVVYAEVCDAFRNSYSLFRNKILGDLGSIIYASVERRSP